MPGNLTRREKRKLLRQEKKSEIKNPIQLRKMVIGFLIVAGILGGGVYFYNSKGSSVTNPLPGEQIADLGKDHVDDIYGVVYNSNPPTSGAHFPMWAKRGIYDRVLSDGYLIHSLEHGYIVISYNCDWSSNEFSLARSVFAHDEPAKESTDSGQILMHMKLVPTETMSAFTPQNSPEVEIELPESFASGDCKGLVNQLSTFLDNYERIIVVPRVNLDVPFALTAWGRLDKLEKFDEQRIEAFIKAYHNRGPERTVE